VTDPQPVKRPATITYALLGLLGLRPHTGYELTRQVHASLRLVWPSSEAHLYREQQRLVRLGWAEVEPEPVGRRTRNRYSITPAGRAALSEWLAGPPAPPSLEVETFVRLWLADQGRPEDLVRSLRSTAAAARASIADITALAAEYLAGGGGFPERAHLNALVGEMVSDVLGLIAERCERAADEAGEWDDTAGRGLDAATRARFERMLARHR
jgi:DNA-binding PadR family transcriptional regulator